MRRFGCVLLLAALAGCAKVDVEAEKTALMTADKEWSQTTKDLDKFMTYFASDATSYAPGAPAVTGADGIRKMMGQIVGAPGVSLSWTASKAVVGKGGDIGYTTGTYEAVNCLYDRDKNRNALHDDICKTFTVVVP